jgi:uncharacterized RmlC-like cupin family protein
MSAETKPTCQVVHPHDRFEGKQALTYFHGISAESVGAQALCMHLLTLPPGAQANAHLHEAHESAIYVISGEAGMWYGDDLSQHLTVNAGDLLYIPAGVPHLPYNSSTETPAVAVIARTDPNEQESVVLRPDLQPPADVT